MKTINNNLKKTFLKQIETMANSITTKISFRSDTLENWNQKNPILIKNELVVVDCGAQTRFKIGDGTSKFKNLKYLDEEKISTGSLEVGSAIAGTNSLAVGTNVSAVGQYSVALGYNSQALSNQAFTWNGDNTYVTKYQSHGEGTFNINPRNGLSGMYIGQQTFASILGAQDKKIDNKIWVGSSNSMSATAELSIQRISRDDYHNLVLENKALSNVIYIVSGENQSMYDQKITNLKNGTDAQDAATYGQLTSVQQDLSTGVQTLSSNVAQKFVDNAIEVENGRHYTLVTASPISSTTSSLIYSIADRTVTTISISSSSKDVVVNLPPALSGNGARDFILRVEISTSTVPGFTFVGYGSEDIVFDSDSSDWCVLEQGLNLISFTETRRD